MSDIGSTLSQMERSEEVPAEPEWRCRSDWVCEDTIMRGCGDGVRDMDGMVLRGQKYDFLSYGIIVL